MQDWMDDLQDGVQRVRDEALADMPVDGGKPSDWKVEDVGEKVDKLTLICAAMWELVKERTGLTEDDLMTRMALIDARDGSADGKMTRRVQPCPACQRPMSGQLRRCQYCGFAKPVESAFDTV